MVPIDPSKQKTPVAEISELEIRAVGADRFAMCPPPGELGQPWYPPPPAWSAPAVPAIDAGASQVDEDFITRSKNYTASENAAEATHREFRACFRQGLVQNPMEEGRVAIVLRVGADGKVAKVEEYAGCQLSQQSIACMKAAASRLHFAPPPSGSDTVVIPAVFTAREGTRRASGSPNDAYTARAYLAMETARPGLHACEEGARNSGRNMTATGTFTLTLGPDGQVQRAHVDPWTGEQSTLACAAHELEKLKFPTPPSGTGYVIARLNFNPRQGGR